MNFKIHKENGIQIIKILNSKATAVISSEFRETVKELIDKEQPKLLLVDFSVVDYIDSSFIGSMVGLYKETKQINGELRVFGLHPMVESVFESTRLYNIFKIFKDKSEALAAG